MELTDEVAAAFGRNVAELLDGTEWGGDVLEQIGGAAAAHGIVFGDPNEAEGDETEEECVECGTGLDPAPGPFDSNGVAWTFSDGSKLCSGCFHDAVRSGWMPTMERESNG